MITSKGASGGVTLPKGVEVACERVHRLPCHRRSAGVARLLLREFLAGLEGGELYVDVGELLLSELVTNAVEHACVSPSIAVQFGVAVGRLRIEVHDASCERPEVRPLRDGDDESGRGLPLVQSLAVAWGCCPRPGGAGKFVWAHVGPAEGAS
ncbi:ATP-binding protein [Kitasatospora kazusensis]|uniref:ATP-binding protein n=1 Tax=Kitasatospora kazusensis TaxID=407974 RepID=UPI0031D117F2